MNLDRIKKGQEVVVNYRLSCDCGPDCPVPHNYLRTGKILSVAKYHNGLVVLDLDGVEYLVHPDSIIRVKRPSARAKVKS